MSIHATPKGAERNPRAVCVCDLCASEDSQPANYERVTSDRWKLNEGQVLNRLTTRGWSHIKGVLRCPSCELKRKGEKSVKSLTVVKATPAPSPAETPPREPTREQKRQIVALLTDVYDVDAGRYKNAETDKTVADTIGSGVMLGWVSVIREEMFGPDGANDELADIEAALAEACATVTTLVDGVSNAAARLQQVSGTVRELQGRVQALKAAVGPRAARV